MTILTDIVFHLRITGILLAGLALMGFFLPKRFNWARDAERMSLLNRQIFLVHHAFIILILAMFSVLTLGFPRALVDPGNPLSKAILTGLALFWFIRLIVQWFVYDRQLWRGHRFNTAMHFLFTGVWLYFTMTFGAALWMNMRGAVS